MSSLVVSYFQNLFSIANITSMNVDMGQFLVPKVNDVHFHIIEVKIQSAIFKINLDKALGSNGFNVRFFS